MPTETGSTYISESMTDIIKILTTNLGLGELEEGVPRRLQ